MNINHYTHRVTWSQEDGGHVGLCAEFPSLSWLDATPEAALAGIRKRVADVVKDMNASELPSHLIDAARNMINRRSAFRPTCQAKA
jgi:hypothetical protein